MSDVNSHEFIVLFLLAVSVLVMGIYPELFIAKMQLGVKDVIALAMQSKL